MVCIIWEMLGIAPPTGHARWLVQYSGGASIIVCLYGITRVRVKADIHAATHD